VGPGDLEKLMSALPVHEAPELLSSIADGEDAAVYVIGDDLALVQTVDFFPPIVDDPFTFGAIAAANALSDIYAMGATPLTAMNLVAFPCNIGLDTLREILEGGYSKVSEAGALMVGGHTIDDAEPKYGLAVTGTVKPSEMTTIGGAVAGDLLVVTKPVGTGILATAMMAEFIDGGAMRPAIESMLALNREAAWVFSRYRVNACTDVTGFGLLGHLYEMMRAGAVSSEVWAKRVPLFAKTVEMGGIGMMPAGLYRNKRFVGDRARYAGEDEVLYDSLFDPQTSGGLLASVHPDDAESMLEELRRGSCPDACVIGVVKEADGPMITAFDERS
jgi:selenide, water dikinase